MFKEFKEFAMRGSVLDMAVGIVTGAAFGKIVTSFVNDVLMPPIGLILGKIDFSNLYINLSGKSFPSLEAAKKAGAATINYGLFITNVLDFLIVSFVVFLLVRQVNFLKRAEQKQEQTPATKECPFCVSPIPVRAIRCPHCTSDLEAAIAKS